EPGGAGMVRVVRQLLAELVVVEHFPRTREPQRGGPDEKTRRQRARRQDDDPTGRHGAGLTDCANEAKQRSTVSRKATAWESPGPARRAISAAPRLYSGLQHDPAHRFVAGFGAQRRVGGPQRPGAAGVIGLQPVADEPEVALDATRDLVPILELGRDLEHGGLAD